MSENDDKPTVADAPAATATSAVGDIEADAPADVVSDALPVSENDQLADAATIASGVPPVREVRA